MSKTRKPGSYGFTTTLNDPFLKRVAQEAKPSDGFFVTSVRDSFSRSHKVAILIRQDHLPPARAGLRVLGTRVSKKGWGTTIRGFKVVEIPTSDPRKTANKAKNDLHRVKNYLAGRHLQVLVEAV